MVGLIEIRTAEIAIQRNLTPQEQAFAQKVITDHRKLNKELADLARMKSIATPDELPAEEQEKLLTLSKVSDPDFNENFLRIMISCHKDSVDLFGDEESTSKDAELKPYAAKMLAELKLHLDTAKQLVARY